jgi:endoglucanase
MIEDGEDGDNQTLVRGGRGGYLYTFKDARGTTITPDREFTTSAGGANGSRQALRIRGTLADAGDVYAGVGLSLTEPKGPYDASRYEGLAFHARRGPDALASVRLKVPDVNTDPDGGACSECHNDFGIDFQVTEEWTRYVVRFADLQQQSGWGEPRPAAIDAARLYSVQWQVATRGARYDLWIDDVTFTGCP